jgi:SAM-dependent methyltransferase
MEKRHERGYWLVIDENNPHDTDKTFIDKMNVHAYDKSLSDAIVNLYKGIVETVIDIGCGDGRYTINFLKNSIDCIGFDGSPLTPEITNDLCFIKDFTEHVDVGKFDLVLCLEVGEHIPQKYEQVFIDNVCHASKKYIVLSWAVEGQPGGGHINCKNNDYIIIEMSKRGFTFDIAFTKYLRKKSSFSWFQNTLMIFNYGK